MFLELRQPLLCQGAIGLLSSQNSDSGVQSDQKAPSLKVSELHRFVLGIPHRRRLGRGKGCPLEPLTRLWGFLLTFWAPSPPLRSHSPVSCSVEKGLSFIFSFPRLSPPPAPRREALQLAALPLACPGWRGAQARSLALQCRRPALLASDQHTSEERGEPAAPGPVHMPSRSSPGPAPPWPKGVSGGTPASRWDRSHD